LLPLERSQRPENIELGALRELPVRIDIGHFS
jgi:hypothetical protein